MCSISYGFCSQISAFLMQIFVTLVTFQCVWVIFDLQMCISNGYGLFASKTSLWQFCLQNHFTRCIGHILAFKHASGHRPCPIACTAFKVVPIITNFSIFAIKTFYLKVLQSCPFKGPGLFWFPKHDW